jgi:predicted nuclease of predicted toxin-antitoxin system
MDEHVDAALSHELRRRSVDVLLVQEDGRSGRADNELFERAAELGRVVFTHDSDFLRIAAQAQATGLHFAGVIYAHVLQVPMSKLLDDLELLAHVLEPAEIANQVIYLPLT